MLSKIATFRSKGSSSSQKLQQQQCERFASQNLLNTEAATSKSNGSYYSSKSWLDDKAPSELSYSGSMTTDASYASTPGSYGNSSPGNFKTHFTYDGKETLTNSSTLSEDIDIGPPVLPPYEDAEEQFLEDYESYFLHLSVDNVRKDQYPKLELQRIVYLDHATCPLYSRFQVEKHMQFLLEEAQPFLGFNTSVGRNNVQQITYIDNTYRQILSLLNTTQDEYSIVFTPGLMSAYRIFSEMCCLRKGSLLLASHDHHKSVQHLVHTAAQSNIKIGRIPVRTKDLCIHGSDMHRILRKQGWSNHGYGLLVYPAQSFLTGICHSLNWIASAQQNGWKVLLDVSSCLPMVNVDLSLHQPEFVIGSLQHILGYPSDVGFLLVRRSSHSICTKKGSTEIKLAELPENGKAVHVVTGGESLSIHTFAALNFGLEHLESIGIVAIQKRIDSLLAWLVKTLRSLKHKVDEKPLLQLYGSLDPKQRGSILTFNVLDSTGNIFPARLLQRLAERSNIFLDFGCLCDSVMANLLHSKSDKQMGVYESALNLEVVRVSLGHVSTFDDAYRLAQFLSRFRDEDYMSYEAFDYVEELENEC